VSLLAERLGLGSRDLVAIVGAGGKSTLLRALGAELAAADRRVVLGTTTKMGPDQVEGSGAVLWSPGPYDVEVALDGPGPVFVVGGRDATKVVGLPPEAFDAIYAGTSADYVVLEADGARRRPVKAPAPHEPVIPETATLVIVTAGIDAVGGMVNEVAHRPGLVAEITGLRGEDRLDAEHVARLLGSRRGGLARIPAAARVTVALTKVGPADRAIAERVGAVLADNDRIDRVALVPPPRSAGHPSP